MRITRKSLLTGITRTKDIPVTKDLLDRWQQGVELIQDVMPWLSASDREFIKTGIVDAEWDEAFGDEEEEEED